MAEHGVGIWPSAGTEGLERLRAMQSWGEGFPRVADRYVTLGT